MNSIDDRLVYYSHSLSIICALPVEFDPKKLIPRARVKPRCKEHDKKKTYYCCRCSKTVCRDCYTIGKHKDHQISSLSEEHNIKFQTLQEQLKLLSQDTRDKVNGHKTKIESVKSKIESNIVQRRKEIDDWFKEAGDVLQATHDELNSELTKVGEEMKNALDVQVNELQKSQLEIKRVLSIVERCLESNSNVDIAECHDVMVQKIVEVKHFCEVQHKDPAVPDNMSVCVTLQPKDSLSGCVKIMGPQADAERSRIKIDDGQRPAVEVEVTFTLTAVYEKGQPCVTRQDIHATVEPPNASVSTSVCVVSSSNSSHRFSYTPEVVGAHTLHAFANGKEVGTVSFQVVYGSPIKIKDSASRCLNLTQPYQIAFTSRGELLVIESSINGRVLKIHDNSCIQLQEFRGKGAHLDYRPQGIATAADGSVYILYDRGSLIVKYNQDGEIVEEHKYEESELKRPGKIKFNENNNELYVCDRGNQRFQVYDSNLNLKRSFAKGRLYSDIAFGSHGVMYLSHKQGTSVYVFNQEERLIGQIGEQKLRTPRGLLYQDDYLYVVDRDNERIAVFETTGNCQLVHSFTDEKFSDPGSIVSDRDGRLYICDERCGQVFIF